jgi:hypothetical protein
METWAQSLADLMEAINEDDLLGVETVTQRANEGIARFALLWSPSMPQKMTALQYALEGNCSIALIRALLQAGASTEPASESHDDGFPESALWMCTRLRRSLETIALLLDFKANVYFTHWLPVTDILPETQYSLLHFLLVQGAEHTEWMEGYARLLIKATGACLINESRNNRQDTPLSKNVPFQCPRLYINFAVLCCRMNVGIPRALLEADRLDLLLRDCNGLSACDYAARNRNTANCIALECRWLNDCFQSLNVISYGRIRRSLRELHGKDEYVVEMFVKWSETGWHDIFGIETDPEEVPLDAFWEWEGAMETIESVDWHLQTNKWFKRVTENDGLFFRLRRRRKVSFDSQAFKEALQLSASGDESLANDEYQPTTRTLRYFEQALERMRLAAADKGVRLEQKKVMLDFMERIRRRLESLRADLASSTVSGSVSPQQDSPLIRQPNAKKPWWRRLFQITQRQAGNWTSSSLSPSQGEHCCPVCSAVLAAKELDFHVAKCIDEAQPAGRHYTIVHIPKAEDGNKPYFECPICYEDMKPSDRIALLDCLCRFHEQCIEAWFFRRSSGIRGCPVHEAR